jgi:hypothetical protein
MDLRSNTSAVDLIFFKVSSLFKLLEDCCLMNASNLKDQYMIFKLLQIEDNGRESCEQCIDEEEEEEEEEEENQQQQHICTHLFMFSDLTGSAITRISSSSESESLDTTSSSSSSEDDESDSEDESGGSALVKSSSAFITSLLSTPISPSVSSKASTATSSSSESEPSCLLPADAYMSPSSSSPRFILEARFTKAVKSSDLASTPPSSACRKDARRTNVLKSTGLKTQQQN